MNIIMMKVADIKADENLNIYHGLADSIKEHGLLVPLQVDSDGRLLEGSHKLQAAKQLGMTEVPVVVV